MDIQIHKLDKSQLHLVREVADKVWPVTFREILSDDQISYMMDMMYAKDVMEREYDGGISFHGVFDGDKPIGYLVWGRCADEESSAKLHKCYLLPEYQGKGLGSRMLQECIQLARGAGCRFLRLNVNRFNEKAIRAYLRNGFRTMESVDNPIGNGYYMNDYVMQVSTGIQSSSSTH